MHSSRRTFLSATTASLAIPAICWGSEEAQLSKANGTALTITRAASRTSVPKEKIKHFTGTVFIDRMVEKPLPPSRTTSLSVTFGPGARTWWHTHPLGQTLLITSGSGWVQLDGKQAEEVYPGDVVWIPENVKHWHGARSDTAMTHIAIQEQDTSGQNAYWCAEVSDTEYLKIGKK
jgi:quercetin dioxygenase-like cupin family protein